MVRYQARLLDSVTGAEGVYTFEHRDDLMKKPADDIVSAFFEYADRQLFSKEHVTYELNGAIKNKKQGAVVAIGSMFVGPDRDEEDNRPFTLFLSRA